jgi:hypothetical protein
MQPEIQYIKKNFDELSIMAVLAKVTLGEIIEPTFDDELVLHAFRRSKNSLEGASLEDIGKYLEKMDDDSISGVVNNVKGILHEIEYVSMENSDGDSVMAGIFPHTNHKDFDVWKYDSSNGEYWVEQLKTTNNTTIVNDWIEEHPEGTIIVNEELADKLGLESSGLNNDALEYRVEDIIEKLKDVAKDDVIWDYFPTLSVLSISFLIWGLYKQYQNDELSKEEFKWMAAKASGLKIAKIATLMLLLSIPIVNVVTGVTITYRLIKSGQQILDS